MMDIETKKKISSIPGLMVIGLMLTGLITLIAGIAALADTQKYVGAGACFIATAISWGVIVRATFS